MGADQPQISEDFAKKLLVSLYKLDAPVGMLDELLSRTQDEETRMVMFEITNRIMEITLHELMVPIYKCHPSLGRASEPGAWLKEMGG